MASKEKGILLDSDISVVPVDRQIIVQVGNISSQ